MTVTELKHIHQLATRKDCSTVEEFNETALAVQSWQKIASDNFMAAIIGLENIKDSGHQKLMDWVNDKYYDFKTFTGASITLCERTLNNIK